MAKVAILTNFMEFQPGYSLTGIVKDQVKMLTKYGNEVKLFVNEQYHGEDFPGDIELCKKMPFMHLVDFMSTKAFSPDAKLTSMKTAAMLQKELADVDFTFTHDFIFTGWFQPYGQGCKEAGKNMPDMRWFHWIHSVPSGMRDYWDIKTYGPAHKIIYPNISDATRVAEQFRGQINDVRVIPHIKDLRSFFEFGDESCKFIEDYPGVMQADIVQIYPASVDRLEAKRVREVMGIFARLKDMGFSVCLVIANQWATGKQQKEDVNVYRKFAEEQGLEDGIDFVFTSDWQGGTYSVGIPQKPLRELMMLSNLFIFPTREESFGLVLPEVALASGCLCVLNKSLTMQLEVSGFNAVYFDFGSYHMGHTCPDVSQYLRDIAFIIAGRMRQNEGIQTKTFMRQMYNMDVLYAKRYAPVMAESHMWV